MDDFLTLYYLIVVLVDKIESDMQVRLIDDLSSVIGSRRELVIVDLAVMVDVNRVESCIPVGAVPSKLIAQQLFNRLHASLNLIPI